MKKLQQKNKIKRKENSPATVAALELHRTREDVRRSVCEGRINKFWSIYLEPLLLPATQSQSPQVTWIDRLDGTQADTHSRALLATWTDAGALDGRNGQPT